ncbi:MAG: hypothetical protein QNK05_12825 [Myxococcota bacterium]|nr:hypothetical protein [Myxococcota bacterium]
MRTTAWRSRIRTRATRTPDRTTTGHSRGIQHYGDACDADLDDDGSVGASDFFGVFRPCLGASVATRPECALADLDKDGVVAPADFFAHLRPALGLAPGPGATE